MINLPAAVPPFVPTVALLVCVGVPVSIIDWRTRRIPDVCSLGGLILAILLCLVLYPWFIYDAALSAALAGGLFFLVRAFRGGLGLGDVKLALFLGAALGSRLVFASLAMAAFYGIAYHAVAYLQKKRDRGEAIPFGPFMVLGAISVRVAAQLIA